LTTQAKLENGSIYSQVNSVDPILDSFVDNITANSNTSGAASAGRKLLASSPAADAPTLYALPIGHKQSYQYVSQPLSAFESAPEAESPEEAPSPEEGAPEEEGLR